MWKIYSKILNTPTTVIKVEDFNLDLEVKELGEQISPKIKKLFKGSLAIREVDAGSGAACEQELTALGNAYYDVERFGVHFVASPRHADLLLVTGPVTRNMREALIRAYEAMPEPKLVASVGDDALDGGIFQGSYAVCDGVDKVIPVDFHIPGDPPSPKVILNSLLKILEIIEKNN